MSLFTINHPTDRPNFTEVQVDDLTVWYSYRTPIGFHHPTTGTVTRENDWSNTTGRHLNHIDQGRKDDRLTGEQFTAQLDRFKVTLSHAPAGSVLASTDA